MPTPLIATGSVPVVPHRDASFIERISLRAGLALVAWSRRAERRGSREQLAELHERRREADRLRTELQRDLMLARNL
ncbi:hypothetical protein [Agromyces sp. H66]|uniref:hypothetical protein n=1 Tax=Agromyces sp. H66 TaxID=2529859 RepID=UPI0010AA5A9D|nr:hypothetical protein [Agromyces sp. H66]